MASEATVEEALEALVEELDALPNAVGAEADLIMLHVEAEAALQRLIERRRAAEEAARQQAQRPPAPEPVATDGGARVVVKRPLGPQAQQALQLAVHVEALEMENAALRAEVAQLEAECRGLREEMRP